MFFDRKPPADTGPNPPPGDPPGGAGHRDRVERLFREHNDTLLRVLNARLRSTQEAREVAQEAYVQLLGLQNPDAVSYLQAFLFKTAINIATNRLKHAGRRSRLDPLIFFEKEVEQAAPSPDRELAARQELELIRNALSQLPHDQQEAFFLTKVDGLSVEEVAQRMRLNPRTAYRYVAGALAHCARLLEAHARPSGRHK